MRDREGPARASWLKIDVDGWVQSLPEPVTDHTFIVCGMRPGSGYRTFIRRKSLKCEGSDFKSPGVNFWPLW